PCIDAFFQVFTTFLTPPFLHVIGGCPLPPHQPSYFVYDLYYLLNMTPICQNSFTAANFSVCCASLKTFLLPSRHLFVAVCITAPLKSVHSPPIAQGMKYLVKRFNIFGKMIFNT